MIAHKRLLKVGGCLALAGLLVSGVVLTRHSATGPLDHARPLMKISGWVQGNPAMDGYQRYYWWSSDGQLSYLGYGENRSLRLFTQSLLTNPTAPLRVSPPVSAKYLERLQLSSDGKWFAEWSMNSKHEEYPVFVAMDGSQRIAGKAAYCGYAVWMPGNRHEILRTLWSRTGQQTQLAIDAPDPSLKREIVLPALPSLGKANGFDSEGRLIGFEFDRHYPQYLRRPGAPQSRPELLGMVRVDLSHPDAKPERWKVSAPEDSKVGSCFLSPSGDRLLWIAKRDDSSVALRKLKRYLPWLHVILTAGDKFKVFRHQGG